MIGQRRCRRALAAVAVAATGVVVAGCGDDASPWEERRALAAGTLESGAAWELGFDAPGSCPYGFGLRMSVTGASGVWSTGLCADPTVVLEAHRDPRSVPGTDAVPMFGYAGPGIDQVVSSAPAELVVTDSIDGYRLFVQWLPDGDGAVALRGLDDGDPVVRARLAAGDTDADVVVLGDGPNGADDGGTAGWLVAAGLAGLALALAAALVWRWRRRRVVPVGGRATPREEAQMFAHLSSSQTDGEYHHPGGMGQ